MIGTQYQREMRDVGAEEIRTMHVPRNSRANKFYKKLGFVETGATMEGGDIFLRLPQNKWNA
jgi:RimJ/RimL family protein N-acetyltransferase